MVKLTETHTLHEDIFIRFRGKMAWTTFGPFAGRIWTDQRWRAIVSIMDEVRKRLGLASDELMTEEEWAIFEKTVLEESIPLGADIYRDFIAELEAKNVDVTNHTKHYLKYLAKWSLVENSSPSPNVFDVFERLTQWFFGTCPIPRPSQQLKSSSSSHVFKDSTGLEAAARELSELRKSRTWVRANPNTLKAAKTPKKVKKAPKKVEKTHSKKVTKGKGTIL